jgi:hypothetical protein
LDIKTLLLSDKDKQRKHSKKIWKLLDRYYRIYRRNRLVVRSNFTSPKNESRFSREESLKDQCKS